LGRFKALHHIVSQELVLTETKTVSLLRTTNYSIIALYTQQEKYQKSLLTSSSLHKIQNSICFVQK